MKRLILACLAVCCALGLNAQSFSVLRSFAFPPEIPYGSVVAGPDGMMYGTASVGGTGGYGTIFKAKPDGTGFTNLYNFQNGVDGANPNAGLVLSAGMLFGTASAGGTGRSGTVFTVSTNGAGFTVLWSFSPTSQNPAGILTNADGSDPEAGLVLSGNKLFGTSFGGGTNGSGVVFALNTSGGGFAVLKAFALGNTNAAGTWTNADGTDLTAGLVLAGTNLFGAAYDGGPSGNGTVFSLGADGGGFALLKTFAKINAQTGINADGANPYGDLLWSGGLLFGTAENGGSAADGTVFSLGTNGAGFSVLKTFSATDPDTGANPDGANPDGGMVLSGTNLFGTTYYGGTEGYGNVFLVSTNGHGFTDLHDFAGSDGANPAADLWLSSGVLFGTATAGGGWNAGAVFSLSTNGGGFSDVHVFTGTNGITPGSGLVCAGGVAFGTMIAGGTYNSGLVFRINTNGTGFAVLRNFSATDLYTGTNTDGAGPQGALVLSGSTLFGTTTGGGTNANGTVFSMGTNGGGFKVLWQFSAGNTNLAGTTTNWDGADPEAGLVLSGGLLFGATYSGGIGGNGGIFVLATNGAGFVSLKNFSAGGLDGDGVLINADGANPEAGLVLAGTNLFGAAYLGGANGCGTIFKLGTNGGGFTVLKTFSATNSAAGTNTDGANPYAGLLLSGATLFGAAENGGPAGNGTLFALGTNGAGFAVLHPFSALDATTATNRDGANPGGGLVLAGSLLYGTASAGGYLGGGALFEISTNGSGFANVHNFSPAVDGSSPEAGLVSAGNLLLGAASAGGPGGGGTVFALDITVAPPLIALSGVGTNITLSWPWPSVGFALQTSTNLAAADWLAFQGAISDNGLSNSLSVNSANGNLFYRLAHP